MIIRWEHVATVTLGFLGLVGLSCSGEGGSPSQCEYESDPPCALSFTMDMPAGNGVMRDETYRVGIRWGDESITAECVIDKTQAIAECAEPERDTEVDWLFEVEIMGPPEAPTGLQMTVDRGDDDSPGPRRLGVFQEIGPSFALFQTGPLVTEVQVDNQRCTECAFVGERFESFPLG